ncbi:glycosyl hydrolase 53 family protein [Amycolatopsis vastitatis]|uniref:glycosyl hydrolase 53 family protein n=1 Tax=Amycolatopsis vastitatis TaxID=1905142 RepID=UPI001F0AE109|nr:glycosyl hydrolase 53 family protein [Amycolatopsis vastitatis]
MTVSRTGRLAKAALFVMAVALPAVLPAPAASATNALGIISAAQPCAGYPATPAGQAANFTAVQDTARTADAIGIFYWEPSWYAVNGNGWDPADIARSGNGWENQAVFDRNGRLNPNVRWKP